ncbi:nucleotide-diphospho-sugar transferase [Phlyctochytrium arcticum]|nr:nucleotide-diphospho-sugar transferase [Phlyctochytrium arcticum]
MHLQAAKTLRKSQVLGLGLLIFLCLSTGTYYKHVSRYGAHSESSSTVPYPRIIHQSWKTETVPELFQDWAESWTRLNPRYQYILWTDETNRQLIKDHYPFALGTYDNLTANIQRADMVRYAYLHRYGGVYADLDVEVLRPMDQLLAANMPSGAVKGKPVAWLGYMSEDYNFPHNIPNAWMASTPGHSLWMHMIHYIMDKSAKHQGNHDELKSPEALTGPIALKTTVDKYIKEVNDPDAVVLLAAGAIYPMDWHHFSQNKDLDDLCFARSPIFDEEKCKDLLVDQEKAFTVTYWSHSWDGNWDDKVGYAKPNVPKSLPTPESKDANIS